MKAMILAAGLGTRLRPLTDDLPKALIALNKRPLLHHAIENLKRQGITDIIINVHHHAQKIVDFLAANKNFDIRIEVSEEAEILETGGGIKRAGWFFNDGKSFVVQNVDVITDLNLEDMLAWHSRQKALATLAVRKRAARRQLLFNPDDKLIGWQSGKQIEMTKDRATTHPEPLSFMGIHIISPQIFRLFPQEKHFSIIKAYLDIVRKGEKIVAYRGDKYYWYDLGKPDTLKEAELFLAGRKK